MEIKTVNFLGSDLLAAKDDGGQVWAGVRWICEGIGLSEGQTKAERLKIQNNKAFSDSVQKFILNKSGYGNRETLCIKLEFVPFWLAKISITPNMKKNQADVADRLLQYQLKVKDALADAFTSESNKNISSEMYLTILRAYVNTYEENIELKKTLDEMKQSQGSGYYMV